MKLKLLWVRHAESISNAYKYKFNIHPFLTYKGLLESFNLGKKLSEIKISTVYCSPLIRTIITSLISITIFNLENESNIKKIKIIPYISEINPIIYYMGNRILPDTFNLSEFTN
jgi:broad specificity phosphatase PhoE